MAFRGRRRRFFSPVCYACNFCVVAVRLPFAIALAKPGQPIVMYISGGVDAR
jgi:hypothetical protein